MTDDGTDAVLGDVLTELLNREPLFHHPELGTSRAVFEESTADDFWEVGASGTVYRRQEIWDILERRYSAGEPDEWDVSEFAVRPLGPHVVLATYLLHQGERVTRRATVWERVGSSWRVIYHQGTLVAGNAASGPSAGV